MSKFKIGDKVRIINSGEEDKNIKKVVNIRYVNNNPMIALDDCKNCYLREDSLEYAKIKYYDKEEL